MLLLALTASSRLWAQANLLPSPENQVFQFMQSGVCTKWTDGSSNKASAYLWIPENCKKVRGLLILCANVPEHRLVGHPAIREVCAKNDLGIVWCVPSFMNFRKDAAKGINNALDYETSTAFLQELLDGLAKTSGYDEVAKVPWLLIGESVQQLLQKFGGSLVVERVVDVLFLVLAEIHEGWHAPDDAQIILGANFTDGRMTDESMFRHVGAENQ